MNSSEYGKCDICGNEDCLHRKYYHYGIKCECHNGDHFELVRHCKNCEPTPPEKTTIYIKPMEEE